MAFPSIFMKSLWMLVAVNSFLLLSSSSIFPVVSAVSSASNGMILRVRLPDGSMERVLIPPGAEDQLSLQDALEQVQTIPDTDKLMEQKQHVIIDAGESPLDPGQTISELGLKHGSILTFVSNNKLNSNKKRKDGGGLQKKPTEESAFAVKRNQWDPFPDLAKDYQSAVLQAKKRRSGSRGLSYGDLAHMQSSLHVVEPQSDGPIKRIQMCRIAAERFFATAASVSTPTSSSSSSSSANTCGLLWGTVSKERAGPKKPRTSLSTSTEPDFCQVAKVHAVWQYPAAVSSSDTHPQQALLDWNSTYPEVWRVATWLGLRPVGWIFAYPEEENRHKDDGLPMFGRDLHTAAFLQIQTMKALDRIEGSRFVTLAMDASTGATEAFQLSDVSVQMSAEGVIIVNYNDSEDKSNDDMSKNKKKKNAKSKSNNNNPRHVPTKHGIIVDGKEVDHFDSVLCLVNTALLSHKGLFAGGSSNKSGGGGKASTTVKKNGSLTLKTKKTLLTLLAAANDNNDGALLQFLCDFQLLLALDKLLTLSDSEKLCQAVKRWSRGLKQSTMLDKKLKSTLRNLLEIMQ